MSKNLSPRGYKSVRFLSDNYLWRWANGPARKVQMKNPLKRGLFGAAALAVPAAAVLALPMAAHASTTPATVIAVSHSIGRPDTTSVSGPATVASPNGPVWAHDNLTFKLIGVRNGAHTWSVTIDAVGTYRANANPLTGASYQGTGAINGWLNYEVTAPNGPNAQYVPYLEPSNFSQSNMVNQLFGGTASIVGGGHYDYVYTGIPGAPHGVYTQVG
jgi:hypothetical protein